MILNAFLPCCMLSLSNFLIKYRFKLSPPTKGRIPRLQHIFRLVCQSTLNNTGFRNCATRPQKTTSSFPRSTVLTTGLFISYSSLAGSSSTHFPWDKGSATDKRAELIHKYNVTTYLLRIFPFMPNLVFLKKNEAIRTENHELFNNITSVLHIASGGQSALLHAY